MIFIMSVRSFFGPGINAPRENEKLIYAVDGIIQRIEGMKLENSTGNHLQAIVADGTGKMRWSDVVGQQGPIGPQGPAGADGAEGLSPNVAFFSKDLSPETAPAVAADSANIPGVNYWYYADDKLSFTKTQTLPVPPASAGDNKFNFYTFSTESLNSLEVGRINTISANFELDNLDVARFIAIYTRPKNDGTDRSSWYNSRIVIAIDEKVESGVEYHLSQFDPVSSLFSTSYSIYDVILTISIGSSSTEQRNGWTFSLNSMRIFLNGRNGVRGIDGSAFVVGVNDLLLEKPFNHIINSDPNPVTFPLLPASNHIAKTVYIYNNSLTDLTLTSGDGLVDFYDNPTHNIYSSVVLHRSEFIQLIALPLDVNRWVTTSYSKGATFSV